MFPLQQFIDYIKKNALFSLQDKILLGVSGGKDSVLMAHLFKLAGFQFSIAHCNFNLRGDESRRDEAFVKLLAANLDVAFYVTHFDTAAYSAENGVSTQMAARELRYQWFEEVRSGNGYQYVAVAHHQDDSIETVLLNLVRGTGISGLHGIRPKRGAVVRPLLFLSQREIDEVVETNRLDFVTDSSNLSNKYARNKIRLEVVPHLKEINPNLNKVFEDNMAHFAETEALLNSVVAQTRKAISVSRNGMIIFDIDAIEKLNPQKLIFYELMRPFLFGKAVAMEILGALRKQTGTTFYSPSYSATINRSELLIAKLESMPRLHAFIHPSDQIIQVGRRQISLSYGDARSVEPQINRAFVDVEQLIFPLVVRFKQDGDRFMPFGMKQFKKLSDFLIDEKIPLPEKGNIPLLINGNGEIIWVAGLRQDNRYKVNATTKKVAIFELSNQ